MSELISWRENFNNIELLEIPGRDAKSGSSSEKFALIITENSEVWYKKRARQEIQKLTIPLKITKASCNSWGALFLTETGRVLGLGDDIEKTGVFGCSQAKHLHSIEGLDQFKISEISLGETHAGGIDNYGQLLTWGSSKQGELGTSSLVETGKPPQIVEKTRIFSIKRVLCRDGFTCISTRGGSVFVFGSLNGTHFDFKFDNSEFFVQEFACGDFIVLLSDFGQVCVLDQCFNTFKLALPSRISSVLTYRNNIYAFSSEALYECMYKDQSWKISEQPLPFNNIWTIQDSIVPMLLCNGYKAYKLYKSLNPITKRLYETCLNLLVKYEKTCIVTNKTIYKILSHTIVSSLKSYTIRSLMLGFDNLKRPQILNNIDKLHKFMNLLKSKISTYTHHGFYQIKSSISQERFLRISSFVLKIQSSIIKCHCRLPLNFLKKTSKRSTVHKRTPLKMMSNTCKSARTNSYKSSINSTPNCKNIKRRRQSCGGRNKVKSGTQKILRKPPLHAKLKNK